MATVSVTTWAELTAAVNSATEDTTVELTSDINMADEFPTGVTTRVRNSSYKIIINGNRHEIKNLYCTIPSSSGGLLGASSSNYMEINNLDFENVYLANSTRLCYNVKWYNCSFSTRLENSEIGSGEFYYCGFTVYGFGKSCLVYGSGNASFYFCNIEVNGEFAYISCVFNDTYIKGHCTAGASNMVGRLTIINATISFTGDFNGSGNFMLYNSDTITVPSDKTISEKLIPCTTVELMSDSILRAKPFPLW